MILRVVHPPARCVFPNCEEEPFSLAAVCSKHMGDYYLDTIALHDDPKVRQVVELVRAHIRHQETCLAIAETGRAIAREAIADLERVTKLLDKRNGSKGHG